MHRRFHNWVWRSGVLIGLGLITCSAAWGEAGRDAGNMAVLGAAVAGAAAEQANNQGNDAQRDAEMMQAMQDMQAAAGNGARAACNGDGSGGGGAPPMAPPPPPPPPPKKDDQNNDNQNNNNNNQNNPSPAPSNSSPPQASPDANKDDSQQLLKALTNQVADPSAASSSAPSASTAPPPAEKQPLPPSAPQPVAPSGAASNSAMTNNAQNNAPASSVAQAPAASPPTLADTLSAKSQNSPKSARGFTSGGEGFLPAAPIPSINPQARLLQALVPGVTQSGVSESDDEEETDLGGLPVTRPGRRGIKASRKKPHWWRSHPVPIEVTRSWGSTPQVPGRLRAVLRKNIFRVLGSSATRQNRVQASVDSQLMALRSREEVLILGNLPSRHEEAPAPSEPSGLISNNENESQTPKPGGGHAARIR